MRVETARLLGAMMILFLTGGRAAAQAPDDSARTVPAAPGDTVLVPRSGAPSRVILTVSPSNPDSARLGVTIEVGPERKVGAASLEDLLRLRRPVWVGVLPLFGPTQGSLTLPDAGSPIRLDRWTNGSERATDEPLIGSLALGWGAPWLPFALNDPRTDATETLDLDALEFPLRPAGWLGPGDLLTRPVPRGPLVARVPADTARMGASRTTLVFRKGTGDAQLTGVRLQTSAAGRRFYASFSRNQGNGWSPLQSSVSERYALSAELGRWVGHRFQVEGLLYERTIEDSVAGDPNGGNRSEWDRRHVTLRASRDGARSSDAWHVGLTRGKETWVLSPDALTPDAGSRERWEFPAITAGGAWTWNPPGPLTGIASIEARSTKIFYQVDSLPAFEPRRDEARALFGARYALGSAAGIGIDAAYDARETGPGLLDGRASLWGGAGRARARIDFESASERPSWLDLLTPPKLRVLQSNPAYPVFVLSELYRSGDPSLRPRRLTGAIGSVTIVPARGLTLEFSGSHRYVRDDFGWNVSEDTIAGTYRVSSVAARRGSGWRSLGSFGWELVRGALRTRGVGWVRAGSDSLSPRSGSPPRYAVDGALDLRVILFQGDLPLRFGIASHARGPREGLIREPAQVTWDGSLAADFGSAGAFVRFEDVFDRRPGSAIWDPTLPAGAPLMGRTFQAGISWNLLD